MTHVDKTKEGRERRRNKGTRKRVRKSRLNTNRTGQDRLIEEEKNMHTIIVLIIIF